MLRPGLHIIVRHTSDTGDVSYAYARSSGFAFSSVKDRVTL